MDKRLRGPAAIVLRAAVVIVAIMVVATVATGWLYWLRANVAHWPGPAVADALPLDELPGHAGVPVVVYLAVFAVAGVMLGLVARGMRLDRLTAGLSLAAGTGVWLLVVDAFCLFVVRQVPAGEGLRAAASLQPVYAAAALAGAGGAVLGRGARPGGLTPRLLGWLVAIGGGRRPGVGAGSARVAHSRAADSARLHAGRARSPGPGRCPAADRLQGTGKG
jgi:hypothetical protein